MNQSRKKILQRNLGSPKMDELSNRVVFSDGLGEPKIVM